MISMKTMLAASAMAFGASLTAAAQQAKSNIDTLVVSTDPEMHCSSCEHNIKENIRFVKGTKKIETSVPRQEVVLIYYKRKASFEKYEAAFAKIGYSIRKKEE